MLGVSGMDVTLAPPPEPNALAQPVEANALHIDAALHEGCYTQDTVLFADHGGAAFALGDLLEGDHITQVDLSGGEKNTLHISQVDFEVMLQNARRADNAQNCGNNAPDSPDSSVHHPVIITGDAHDSIDLTGSGLRATGATTDLTGTAASGDYDVYTNAEGDHLLLAHMIAHVTTG